MVKVNPVLGNRRLSWLRLLPPAPDARSAVVLERPGGYRLVTMEMPLGLPGFVGQGFRQCYRVDLTPRELERSYELPSSELARPFRAELKLVVQVANAVQVVKEQVTDVWEAIEPVVRLPLRQIGRRHEPDKLAAVEEELHAFLTNRVVAEVGLRVVRAGVSVDLDGPDLKREREKIDERHRRELAEAYAQHRVRLEKAEASHQRELNQRYAEHRRELEKADASHQRDLDDQLAKHQSELEAARERHHRALEAERRKLYEEVLGEELPKLLLIRLGARAAGGDPKELDEIIELMTQTRVENFKVPLELLAQYAQLMERWQLEKPVETLLAHLLTTFAPQLAPPRAGGQGVVTIEGEPAEEHAAGGNSQPPADDGPKPPPDDQER